MKGNMLTYNENDLDYIFIRAKDKNGKWASLSINQITDEQFVDWIKKNYGCFFKDAPDQVGKPWTSKQKVDILNHISKAIFGPCVFMIKRDKRKEFNHDKNGKLTEDIGEAR